jgi:hypothetical protein
MLLTGGDRPVPIARLTRRPGHDESRGVTPQRQPPFAYMNRRGETYYLHAGTTKTGKPRYFVAKTIGAGALSALPTGFEIVESVNSVVSVRRVDPDAPTIPAPELDLVRNELARHQHLGLHRADVVKGEIVVFEPVGGLTPELIASGDLAGRLGIPLRLFRPRPDIEKRIRYTPVMKFVPADPGYAVHSMTYRGDGGWSWPLDHGQLAKLVAKYLPHVGTEKFFQTY